MIGVAFFLRYQDDDDEKASYRERAEGIESENCGMMKCFINFLWMFIQRRWQGKAILGNSKIIFTSLPK